MKEHNWHPEHMWDFPMLPHRFVESSCLKCHHQVTDLIDSDNRNNAPKLLRGYNLIKENGCFGCHEIGGRKGGRAVGPDLRLEPYPPRDDRTPAEVAKLDADPDEAPGYMRKVGPSLFRLSEKTNKEWTAKWIKSPRDFRPDTKMPHFYGLSNNNKEALKGTGQEEFPDAEAYAITHYLFANSSDYLKRVETARADNNPAKHSELENKLQALERLDKLDDAQRKQYADLKKQLDELKTKDALAKVHAPLKLEADPLQTVLPARLGESDSSDWFFREATAAPARRKPELTPAPVVEMPPPVLPPQAEPLMQFGFGVGPLEEGFADPQVRPMAPAPQPKPAQPTPRVAIPVAPPRNTARPVPAVVPRPAKAFRRRVG